MKSLAEFYSLIRRFERESVSGSVLLTLCDPWTVAPGPSVRGVLQEEHWSGVPCSPPGAFPHPGIEPRSPALQADSLLSGPPWKPKFTGLGKPLSDPRANEGVQRSPSFRTCWAPLGSESALRRLWFLRWQHSGITPAPHSLRCWFLTYWKENTPSKAGIWP